MPAADVELTLQNLLAAYDANLDTIRLFRDQLLLAVTNSQALDPLVHSVRSRIKDRDHLEGKLRRKHAKCLAAGEPFQITADNLLTSINDLAGIRLLHLHTRQIEQIHEALQTIFEEQRYELVEPPFARTWDDESRQFFQTCGIQTQESPTMYTSVHYVVSSASRTTVTCELQVRTLSEEVWGEVDHAINYPEPTDILASREQLKVLARVTSSASRLVDSIFLTHDAATEQATADS